MSNADLQKIVQAAGLSEKESQLYVAGLEIGSALASEYARKTQLNRITAYNQLENLVQRGLFTAVRRTRGRYYAPVEPDALAIEARKNVDALSRSLPLLRSLQGSKHRKPHVRFYAGWEGVRRVYEDTLTAGSDLLNYANSALVRQYWPDYDEEYVAERVKRGIFLRGIAPDDTAGRDVHGHDAEAHRDIQLVPADSFDFNNEINIYDDKVAIISFGDTSDDMFGVIMESPTVANTHRQIFEMAWRYAAKTG